MIENSQQLIDKKNEQIYELFQQGKYQDAIPIAVDVLALTKQQTIGEFKTDYATALNNLAELYRLSAKYQLAEPLYSEAIEIDRKILGEDAPGFATDLNNLAQLYKAIGDYLKAEPLYRQAINIWRNLPDKECYFTGLSNLAGLLTQMGNYLEAKELYHQVIEFRHKLLGENHPQYATSLNDLGVLYITIGKLDSAKSNFEQAIAIMQRENLENHPDYANYLAALAEVSSLTGNYKKAMQIYNQSLEISRITIGENHPNFAIDLTKKAQIFQVLGQYSEADQLYQEALSILRQTVGEYHDLYASGLEYLAGLYLAQDRFTDAEQYYKQAHDILLKTLGDKHPRYGACLNNLAELYRNLGSHKTAKQLFKKALKIQKLNFGNRHPDRTTMLNNMALEYAITGDAEKAFILMQDAAKIDDDMLGQVFSASTENERISYLKKTQINYHGYLSLILQRLSSSKEVVQAAFEMVLHRKGLGNESLIIQRYAVLGERYPVLMPKLQELTGLRCQIAQKILAGPNEEGKDAHQERLREWEKRKDKLETELAHSIPEMHLERLLQQVDRSAIAYALPARSTMVEFVRIEIFDLLTAQAHDRWQPAHYIAFVLHAGKPDSVEMIDLGEAESIERLISGFRDAISYERKNSGPKEQRIKAIAQNGLDLRRVLFDPLLPALGGSTRIFVAPDGELARLPFEVLPLDRGAYLIDDYQFSYLNVAREVLHFGMEIADQPSTPMVIADPDFDLSIQGEIQAKPDSCQSGRLSSGFVPKNYRFDRLPGTRKEGERIANLLGVKPLLQQDAIEGNLKKCSSPIILHIATHGFFLEDQPAEYSEKHNNQPGRLANALEYPLLRSNLALAGANTWLKEQPLPLQAEDAILNAEDASSLDLRATQLVVLSACETALGANYIGDVDLTGKLMGEGVLGLRKAFLLAGAKTVVMSSWKIPDLQTQELMKYFYHKLIAGSPRAEALREAQLAIKAKYPDPFYWGAFICQGDPAPLDDHLKIHLIHQNEGTAKVSQLEQFDNVPMKGSKPMDQKMRTWTPEQSLQAFKEGVTAFLGIILVGYTLYIANSVLIFVGDQQKMSDAKDVLLLLLGLAGVVIGYYFGRVPADARAVQAQEQARTATIQAEQVATQTRSATDQIDQLFSRMSSTAEAGATRGGPEAGSETQDVMAEMKRIRESLRQVSSNSR